MNKATIKSIAVEAAGDLVRKGEYDDAPMITAYQDSDGSVTVKFFEAGEGHKARQAARAALKAAGYRITYDHRNDARVGVIEVAA
ncbi:MAG: hypothetical protein Q8Q14_11510 [Gemmatimonadales bacterium]|nr:hypothetical protein [Gemmatimonadales bacterium]